MPKLDERLGGGILSNSMILIVHQTGYRYADFINRIMTAESEKEFFVILVDYVGSMESLYYKAGVFESKGEEVKDYKVLSTDKVRIINCSSRELGNEKYLFNGKVYTLDDPFDTDKLFSIMRTVRESLPENAWVIWVFFSLTDLSIGVSEPEIAKFFRHASRLHKQYGDPAFYFLNMDAHNPMLLATISQMADFIINLRTEETEEKLRKYIQVIKSPFPIDTKRLYYDIDPDGDFIYY
jgi:KaiC/GvpD/RAD55 family RecA-like ATPase